MAHVVADRVKETSTTTGTDNLTLAGAATAFQAFSAVCVNNDTFFYCVAHQTANEWEIGYGTYVSATPAIARTTVIESSNADAAVSFSAGTKDVFITNPAVGHSWGVLSPAQLTADQNDYNPAGLKYASFLRLDTDNVRQITGLQGGFNGRRIVLHCLDAAQGPVILRDESASSTANNRFNLHCRRVWIYPGESIEFIYDAVSARWIPIHGNAASNAVQGQDYLQIFDDFLTGSAGVATASEAGETIGAWEWRCTAAGTATNSTVGGGAGHVGILGVGTGATSGNDTRIHLANTGTDDVILFQDVQYMAFIVLSTNSSSLRIKCGLGIDLSDATVAAWGANAVFFEFDTATNANWRTHTRAASTTTTNTTSIAVTTSEWDLLEAYRLTNGNWSFWINETLVFTHSTNLPTTVAANIGVFIETQTAASRVMHLDAIALRTARLGQRYT